MATQRDRYAVQFQVTENDQPSEGVIASLNALQIQGLETALSMSDNLFLRKAGKAMIALQDSALSEELVTEKLTLEQRIADTLATLAMDREGADESNATARETLVKAKFPSQQIDTMINGLCVAQELEFEAVRGQVAEMQARITAIELTPVREVNSLFLDGFAKVSTPTTTSNGSRSVSSTVQVVHFENMDYYVAVEQPDNWRIYDKDKVLLVQSAQCPKVSISSRTKARKVVYALHFDTAYGKRLSIDTLNKVNFAQINAGGVGVNGDLIETHQEGMEGFTA